MSVNLLRLRRNRQDGYVLMLALGVMVVTMLILAAVFSAVQGDQNLSAANLNGKRAYSAAEAGLQVYLGQLNTNASSSTWWQTCANDTASGVAVPGTTGATYSYQPVINQTDSPSSYCASTGALGTVVDPSTGLLRMEFTGSAGNGAQRTIVADFRPQTPLAYLWYTVHETEDPSINSACPSGTNDYANGPNVPSSCWLYWGTGAVVNGPMYTQDQFLVAQGAIPYFGRASSNDSIASPNSSLCVVDPGTGAQPVPYTSGTTCPSGIVRGKAAPNAALIPLPADNSNLYTDAVNYGVTSGGQVNLPAGTTTLSLYVSNGTTYGNATTCTSASVLSCTYTNAINLTKYPILYTANSGTCTSTSTFTPASVSYNQVAGTSYYYGNCGDLYVSGTYASSLTLAAGNSIVVTGNLENSTDTNGSTSPTGSATLGLVANGYVRVYHQANSTAQSITIDAAILALNHSFTVDNYTSGSPGTLTIHGSIAQEYRGPVATQASNGNVATGYQKNYVYDDRLKILLPAYLFDLQNTSWSVVRETLCASGLPSTSTSSCAYILNAG